MTSELYAHVKVGDCDIAIPASDIVQAFDVPETGATPLPRRDGRANGALAGVLTFGGSVVPIVALDRWLPLGDTEGSRCQRVLILQKDLSMIAVQIDSLRGVRHVPAGQIRVVCHDDSEEEIFQAVAPAIGDRPLLCLLEVARLMRLADVWCAQADIPAAKFDVAGISGNAAEGSAAASVPHVVFGIGSNLWAVPACAVSRLEKTPKAEFRLAGQMVCGIGPWGTRKVPLVDLGFAHDEAGTARPLMAVITLGADAVGVLVDHCESVVNLVTEDIVLTPQDKLRAGTAIVTRLGSISVLDIDRLFDAVPESTISRVCLPPERKLAETQGTIKGTAQEAADSGAMITVEDAKAPDYLVFETDRPYASPATGLIGVMKLSQSTIDDFAQGRRPTIDWRGQTLGVSRMPQIDGGDAKFEPLLAVVVKGTNKGDCERAVAIRSLTRWLPARSVQRSTMRIPSLGEVDVVMPPGAQRSDSLVIVDLAQIGYLLA